MNVFNHSMVDRKSRVNYINHKNDNSRTDSRSGIDNRSLGLNSPLIAHLRSFKPSQTKFENISEQNALASRRKLDESNEICLTLRSVGFDRSNPETWRDPLISSSGQSAYSKGTEQIINHLGMTYHHSKGDHLSCLIYALLIGATGRSDSDLKASAEQIYAAVMHRFGNDARMADLHPNSKAVRFIVRRIEGLLGVRVSPFVIVPSAYGPEILKSDSAGRHAIPLCKNGAHYELICLAQREVAAPVVQPRPNVSIVRPHPVLPTSVTTIAPQYPLFVNLNSLQQSHTISQLLSNKCADQMRGETWTDDKRIESVEGLGNAWLRDYYVDGKLDEEIKLQLLAYGMEFDENDRPIDQSRGFEIAQSYLQGTVQVLNRWGLACEQTSADNLNCFIYALLQRITGRAASELKDLSNRLRADILRQFGDEAGMLNSDGPVAEFVCKRIDELLGVKVRPLVVIPSAYGPMIVKDANNEGAHNNAFQIPMLNNGGHFEPLKYLNKVKC